MSLKKEIMAAVKADRANVKINDIAILTRWTNDALGYKVDKMTISFKYIGGVKGGWAKDIDARDYDGIVEEINAATAEYMAMCAEQLASNLKAGYR